MILKYDTDEWNVVMFSVKSKWRAFMFEETAKQQNTKNILTEST